MKNINRREALHLTAQLLGCAIIGAQSWLSGCTTPQYATAIFNKKDIDLLDEIGEVILPKTELSGGAKEAHIGLFMQTIVTDCYDSEEQKIFLKGIPTINELAIAQYQKAFINLKASEKFKIIAHLDIEAKNYDATQPPKPHYFSMIKQLTIWGYFSSEIGCTQALRYNPVPGRYDGCIPYKMGDKAWG